MPDVDITGCGRKEGRELEGGREERKEGRKHSYLAEVTAVVVVVVLVDWI
jgi:hypothetical protein